MHTRLIYHRPLPGSALTPILTEMSQAELVNFVGPDLAQQLLDGDVLHIGDYAVGDLVAFFNACAEDLDGYGDFDGNLPQAVPA